MRILLINPPAFRNSECIAPDFARQTHAFNYPPLGLLYLAANLTGGHECRVLDAIPLGLNPEGCLREVRGFRPDIVGVTVFADSLYACRVLVQQIKAEDPRIRIVLGGPHANLYPRELAGWHDVDFVMTGFCENTFNELVATLANHPEPARADLVHIAGLYWPEGSSVVASDLSVDPTWDIAKIRRPDRTLLDLRRYFTVANNRTITTAISSRGCTFKCTFCDVFEKRFLARGIDDIIAELREIVALGIREVHFFDDCFNLKRQRTVEMCEAMIQADLGIEWSFRGRITPCDEELTRLLYRAGCRRVQLGIEGTNAETLRRIKKGIDIERVPETVRMYRKAGILTMGYFILGFPFQTHEDCVQSCQDILEMGLDYINAFILIPYPKTEIHEDLRSQGLIDRDYWYEHTVSPRPDFKLPHWHPHVDRAQLDRLLNRYYKKFYWSPRFVWSEISRTRSLRGLAQKSRMAFLLGKNRVVDILQRDKTRALTPT
ncbi:MAG: radical SAM protein [Phycisphaerae bacterium]|nr:radical SAM protein [Phycisphaerae bacterium]